MAATLGMDDTLRQIVAEAKKLKKSDREKLLKELQIRRLLAEDKPIVRSPSGGTPTMEEINEIKHFSRQG
jgi:hypothetical protein